MSNVSSKSIATEPQPAAPNKKIAPWSAALAVVATVVAFSASQIIASFLVGLYPLTKGWSNAQANNWLTNSAWAQFLYVLFTEGLTIFVLWLFWRRYKKGVKIALGIARKPVIKDVGYALIGVLVYFGLYMIVFGVINSMVSVNTSQQQDVGFDGTHGSALILTFISLVILPPLVEEITFRGFLFSGLKRRFGPGLATLGTSLLFAAPHLLTGKGSGLLWIAAIDTFSLSLVLCYLREKTGALYSGMLVHAAKNAIAFAALFIFIS